MTNEKPPILDEMFVSVVTAMIVSSISVSIVYSMSRSGKWGPAAEDWSARVNPHKFLIDAVVIGAVTAPSLVLIKRLKAEMR